MESHNRKVYEYWLHNLPGIGDRTIEKLLLFFGSAGRIYEASEKEIEQVLRKKEKAAEVIGFRNSWDLQWEYEKLLKKNISFYTAEDAEYPGRLKKLVQPPFGIYCRGQLPPEEKPAVAIIGARECSGYGVNMAEAFGKALAAAGVAVVSGMARGIDSKGHSGILDGGGKTIAVLGCGADICYPPENEELMQRIIENGCIISEFPPGTPAQPQHFPADLA